MKRIVVILTALLLFPLAAMMAEEIQLDTPYEEDPKLFIPEDYETLREHYIELATLYQEQKYDLEQSVGNTGVLLENQQKLLSLHNDTRELLTGIKKDLDRPTLPEILNHGPLVGAGIALDGGYTFHGSYQIEILRSLLLQVQLSWPPEATVMIGWKF